MQYRHELIRLDDGLNAKIFVHSVLEVISHWHHEIELILVLKGSVTLRKENRDVLLQQNDVVLLNRNELHSIKATEEENILLAVQFSPDLFGHCYQELEGLCFVDTLQENKTSEQKAQSQHAILAHLAEIMWAFSKKQPWFKFSIERELQSLLVTLLNLYPYQIIEQSHYQLREKELSRLTRIVNFIGNNYAERVQLQDIAEKECVTVYHLSRFFKDQMGVTFQEYLFDYRIYNAAKQVVGSEDKISDIAYRSGFNDLKLFYKKFKSKYHHTPMELRKRRAYLQNADNATPESYMSVDDTGIYGPLFSFRHIVTSRQTVPEKYTRYPDDLAIDTKAPGSPVTPVWNRLITFGCAYEALKFKHQRQLQELQQHLGFDYVRFQGIFNDQMQIVCERGGYNWDSVDELVDFLLSIGLEPFFCLGYMPELLASDNKTVAYWKGNISPPAKMESWLELVNAFFTHLLNRYTKQQVTEWYFEIWNEPDLEGVFWSGSESQYHELYRQTYHTIRAIDPDIKIGSPSVSHISYFQSDWMSRFVSYCQIQQLKPDFFSYHVYPEQYGKIENLIESHLVSRKTLGENGSLEQIEAINPHIDKLGCAERHITEWNISACWGNKVLDTAYLGSFIAYNAIKLFDRVDSLGVWTFSDLFEERGPVTSTFHGGFGLMTREGIKKPGFHALALLNKLGTHLLARSENHIVTRSESGIQILMVNYVHVDGLYASGDISAVEMSDPYAAFNESGDKNQSVSLSLENGKYKVTRYQLNRKHGSAYDEWQAMGSPEPLSDMDISELHRLAWPKRLVGFQQVTGGILTLNTRIPPHGVELIEIEPDPD